ncbi:unnamed protein product, partial [marine sediment metagenome]
PEETNGYRVLASRSQKRNKCGRLPHLTDMGSEISSEIVRIGELLKGKK